MLTCSAVHLRSSFSQLGKDVVYTEAGSTSSRWIWHRARFISNGLVGYSHPAFQPHSTMIPPLVEHVAVVNLMVKMCDNKIRWDAHCFKSYISYRLVFCSVFRNKKLGDNIRILSQNSRFSTLQRLYLCTLRWRRPRTVTIGPISTPKLSYPDVTQRSLYQRSLYPAAFNNW